jgi:hypothetical protein
MLRIVLYCGLFISAFSLSASAEYSVHGIRLGMLLDDVHATLDEEFPNDSPWWAGLDYVPVGEVLEIGDKGQMDDGTCNWYIAELPTDPFPARPCMFVRVIFGGQDLPSYADKVILSERAQRFDRPIDLAAFRRKMISKYGPPSFEDLPDGGWVWWNGERNPQFHQEMLRPLLDKYGPAANYSVIFEGPVLIVQIRTGELGVQGMRVISFDQERLLQRNRNSMLKLDPSWGREDEEAAEQAAF